MSGYINKIKPPSIGDPMICRLATIITKCTVIVLLGILPLIMYMIYVKNKLAL
jgi:hypothetical protein